MWERNLFVGIPQNKIICCFAALIAAAQGKCSTTANRAAANAKVIRGISRTRVKILLGLGIGGAVFFLAAMIPDLQPNAQAKDYQQQLYDCSGKMAAPLQIWTNNQAASEQIEQYRKADDFAAADAAYQRYTSSFDAAQDALKKMTDIEFEFKALKEKQAEFENTRHAGMVFKLFLAGGCVVFAFPWLLYLFLVPKKKS